MAKYMKRQLEHYTHRYIIQSTLVTIQKTKNSDIGKIPIRN